MLPTSVRGYDVAEDFGDGNVGVFLPKKTVRVPVAKRKNKSPASLSENTIKHTQK